MSEYPVLTGEEKLGYIRELEDQVDAQAARIAEIEAQIERARQRIYSYAYADAMRWGSGHDKADEYGKAQAAAIAGEASGEGAR